MDEQRTALGKIQELTVVMLSEAMKYLEEVKGHDRIMLTSYSMAIHQSFVMSSTRHLKMHGTDDIQLRNAFTKGLPFIIKQALKEDISEHLEKYYDDNISKHLTTEIWYQRHCIKENLAVEKVE